MCNALESDWQKKDWDPGENEGPLEANECDSEPSQEGDEEEQDEEMTDDLLNDDAGSAASDATWESRNTSAVPRRGGSIKYRLTDEVWQACQSRIEQARKKYANKPNDEDMRDSLEAIIDKSLTGCKWQQASEKYGILAINTLSRRYHRWVEIGLFKILVNNSVLKASQLPPSPRDMKNLRRKNARRRGRRIKYRLTKEVWEACRLTIHKTNHQFARNRDDDDVRAALEGIVKKLLEGLPWKKVPEKYGKWFTLWDCYGRWLEVGIFRILVNNGVLKESQLVPYPGGKKKLQRPAPPKDATPPRQLKIDLDGLNDVLANIDQIEDKDAVREALLDAAAGISVTRVRK